jgi:RsiW-degrading membrane proteinase PrsW (M82 family)
LLATQLHKLYAANQYDLMNDVLSFGAHRLWKHYTIATSNVKAGDKVLDIAIKSVVCKWYLLATQLHKLYA